MTEHQHRSSIREWIGRRPWLFIWVAFGILIGAWSILITIALENRPQAIPLPVHPPTTAVHPPTTVDADGRSAAGEDGETEKENEKGGERDGN